MTRYVKYTDTKEVIDAIRRSGAKIDPMQSTPTMLRVADWVPRMVKTWRDSGYAEALPLEDFLRKMDGRTPPP